MFSPAEIAWMIVLLGIFPFVAIGISYFLVRYGLSRVMRLIMGRLPVFIADRYLLSRQHRGAINIITFISVLGVTYVCYVLIVILSVSTASRP